MRIRLRGGLPFVTANIVYQEKRLELNQVLIDTGSSGTVFSADKVASIGLVAEPQDPLRQIRGVGGSEFVFVKQVDILSIGRLEIQNFEIEIGAMDYDFDIEGIVGMDFLMHTEAIIDFAKLEIKYGKK